MESYTHTKANITWETSQLDSNNFDHYKLQLARLGKDTEYFITSESNYELTTLEPMTDYSVAVIVVAKDPFGQSIPSNSKEIKTRPEPPSGK